MNAGFAKVQLAITIDVPPVFGERIGEPLGLLGDRDEVIEGVDQRAFLAKKAPQGVAGEWCVWIDFDADADRVRVYEKMLCQSLAD
ncbi:hypothetical protein GCM10022238_22000 [Gordonia hankookensis]